MYNSRVVHKEKVIPASLAQVWQAWTTPEGATTFFAPAANIELRIGGKYELYFNPEEPEGKRGSEQAKVLSFLPQRMLSFSWNAPVDLGEIRFQHTWAVLHFRDCEQGTVVEMNHLGWGEGVLWDQAFAYFERAWDIVFNRLEQRFIKGPLDWDTI